MLFGSAFALVARVVLGERGQSAARRCAACGAAAKREPLAAALAAFERLGAGPWAGCALAGLRAAGVATGPTAATGLSALSEREQQVAGAASAGETNREIAAEPVVSPRIVELHLAAAFRKLGIRRRTELAHVIGPAVDPQYT